MTTVALKLMIIVGHLLPFNWTCTGINGNFCVRDWGGREEGWV